MTTRIKDYVDINDHVSLNDLIERLTELQMSLPEDCEAELRLRGDEVFGRRLSIAYFRPLTAEEEACEARYADSTREPLGSETGRLKPDQNPNAAPVETGTRGKFQAAA